MDRLYTFEPRCRNLDNYEKCYQGRMCIIIDYDTEKAMIEFDDKCRIQVPKGEVQEVKFANREIFVK